MNPRARRTARRLLRLLKKLRRQSKLSGLAFEAGEIGVWTATEAALERAGLVSQVEAPADAAPAHAIDACQVACAGRSQPGPDAGDQANRAAHHGSGRGRLATGGAALVIAAGAEELLEIVVGARQVGHLVAVEQPGPIALRHFPEVVDRAGERSGFGAMLMHGAEQPVEAAAHDIGGLGVVVGEHVGDRMHPAVGARNGGPEGGGVLETMADQLAQPDEARRRGPPFLVAWPRPPVRVTRSRLPAIFSRRVFSFSPEAASGARPSSVIAERTAAQYPPTTAAAGSLRPSLARSMARIPRTFFFNSFLAWRSAS